MSNQPMSMDRFAMLLSMVICIALVGQGIGLLVGAAFGIQGSMFIALMSCLPFVLFAGKVSYVV